MNRELTIGMQLDPEMTKAPGIARSLSAYFPADAPMRTRTSNLLIRSQMLYPIELWARAAVPHGRYKTRTCDLHDVNVAL
jgi:hypothetical protein